EISAQEQAETLLEQKSLELFYQVEERQRMLDALRESEERYRLIVETSPDVILIEIDGKIVFTNPSARLIFRETQDLSLLDRSLTSLIRRAKTETDALRQMSSPDSETEEVAFRLDGSAFDVSVYRVSLSYQGQPAIQMVVRDISNRKKLEYQLAFQATHDALTGTNNRSALLDRLSDAIAYARRNSLAVWVAFIDLDRFKLINDHHGHLIGDQVLTGISQRLRSVLRSNDVLGCYGGDEFIVVLRGGPEADISSETLERMMQAVSEPMKINGHSMSVNCSVGVAVYPQDGETPQQLLEMADAAMYRAKQSGRNRCQFFNQEIQAQLQERARIESEFTSALARGEFLLQYQPQIDLRSGAVAGAEALLRWQHPELGLLPPERFVYIAEESAYINEVGAWVLNTATAQCADWHKSGLGYLRVAVNLSARQLNGQPLIRLVEQALSRSGLPPNCLELELTESLMMSNIELTLETLQILHAMGVQIANDDFGTGYSNFAYLRKLPISCLKIDRQFINDLSEPSALDTSIITQTLITLAHNLQLRVVAEGVETENQLDLLRQQGCDEIQGFIYSEALSADDFRKATQAHDSVRWQRKIN
ncbi:MAG: EAL domain-containing protein, partial [Betaproteobacteria bacterium]|nr:EAL domain-containing protein [Betaproteobacteria bacterium]